MGPGPTILYIKWWGLTSKLIIFDDFEQIQKHIETSQNAPKTVETKKVTTRTNRKYVKPNHFYGILQTGGQNIGILGSGPTILYIRWWGLTPYHVYVGRRRSWPIKAK